MNSAFKTLTCITLLVLWGSMTALAQEETSDAVYNRVVKEYTLHPDGSWEYHYSGNLKLFTYYAFHTLYGEDFIVYDPLYQKLKINRSNTVMADGKLVKGPENALNEVLPGYAANAPAFNRLREMVVTHTGLERGAVIDFDYTISSAPGFTSGLSGNEQLMLNSPAKEMKLIIHMPKGSKLNYSQFNIENGPSVVKEAGGTTYTWNLANVPAATREDFRPRDLRNRPRVVFTTAANCEKMIRPVLEQPAFRLETGEALRGKINDIIKDKTDDLKRMLAIQDFVVNEINYFPVPAPVNGFRMRTPAEVFAGNGGNEPEKAILLAASLRSAGFQAEPVAVFSENLFDNRSDNLYLAEKYLVRVISRSMAMPEPVYISPIQGNNLDEGLTLTEKKVVSLLPATAGKMLKPESCLNSLELSGVFELGSDMVLQGKLHGTFEGRFNPYFRLYQDSSYCRKLLAGQFDGKDVKEGIIENLEPGRVTAAFSVGSSDKVKENAGHYFLRINPLSAGIEGWHMTELVSDRKEPLEIPFPVKESYRFSITLPEGFELITPEYNEKVSRKFGEFRIEIVQEGKTLQVDRIIEVKQAVIDRADYDDFRSFINTWNSRKYRDLIIRKGPK